MLEPRFDHTPILAARRTLSGALDYDDGLIACSDDELVIRRYGASVANETSDVGEAYATAERFRRERPSYWSSLPWG